MTSSLSLLKHVIFALSFQLLRQQNIFATADASTDFVSTYYQSYWYQASKQFENDSSTEATLQYEFEQDIPDEVTTNLEPFGLSFSSLPGLLQRALIWDSGYVQSDNGSLAKIYTRCVSSGNGATMDDLALETNQIVDVGCEVQNCSVEGTTTASWSFSSSCGPSQIDAIVQCACTSVKTKVNGAPVWTTSDLLTTLSNDSEIPDVTIRRHSWSNITAGRSAVLFAIHTSSELQDEHSSVCESETFRPLLAIPCIEYHVSDDRWCRPKRSSLMTQWLDEYVVALASSSSAESGSKRSVSSLNEDISIQYTNDGSATSDTHTTNLHNDDIAPGNWHRTTPVLIVGGAALVVTGIAVFIYLRRRSDRRKADLQNSVACQLSISSTWNSQSGENSAGKSRKNPLIERENVFGNPHSMHDFLDMLSSSPTALESSPLSRSIALTAESLASGSPKPDDDKDARALNALANDPQLKHAQIKFDLLQFHHLIARESHTEVWLCVLRDRCVAVKRLLREQRRNLDAIRVFIETIRLSAPLQHSSILCFVGVAWSSLQNVCLVTEYLELGDLHEYLRQSKPNRDQCEPYECFSLTWKREKIQLLLDIARGLDYLHQNRIIHGNLKTKNVLLSSELDAKLAGFGVMHHRSDNVLERSQRTVQLDSPFWIAPEVLAGDVQSEKGDIYSLGVVITELDTHRSPFWNSVIARGYRMSPLQVLQNVISGHLNPSLSSTCPDEIVHLAEWCLHRDPSFRPSARDVVQAVRSIPGFNLDEFSL